MTPRSIETDFSTLLNEHVGGAGPVDLTLHGPLLSGPVHPKVLWATLSLAANPGQEIAIPALPGWSYQSFDQLSTAQISHSAVALVIEGRPWKVAQFISGPHTEAILDFHELGAVYLVKGTRSLPVETGHKQTLLSIWLTYALSAELWGTQGKWTRFHERLHALFHDRDLLMGEDSPGHYPLKPCVQSIEKAGFQGTKLDKTYLLVLPWSFSLSALQRLEEIISEEFPCLS